MKRLVLAAVIGVIGGVILMNHKADAAASRCDEGQIEHQGTLIDRGINDDFVFSDGVVLVVRDTRIGNTKFDVCIADATRSVEYVKDSDLGKYDWVFVKDGEVIGRGP